jgi:hypothetical protein
VIIPVLDSYPGNTVGALSASPLPRFCDNCFPVFVARECPFSPRLLLTYRNSCVNIVCEDPESSRQSTRPHCSIPLFQVNPASKSFTCYASKNYSANSFPCHTFLESRGGTATFPFRTPTVATPCAFSACLTARSFDHSSLRA